MNKKKYIQKTKRALKRARIYKFYAMTEEKLKKAEELLKRINHLWAQKEKWEQAINFSKIELSATVTYCGGIKYIDGIDTSFINFEDIKLLALAKIQGRISELQKEFDSL